MAEKGQQEVEAPPEEWLEQLIRRYQDTLTGGLYEAIYALEGEALDSLMRAQGLTCAHAFLRLADIDTDTDLDTFLRQMEISGPSKVRIERQGDTILWTELHQGQCICPFVRRGVIRLDPKLCICGAYWVKFLLEAVVKRPVKVEMIETVATGAENCVYRIELGD